VIISESRKDQSLDTEIFILKGGLGMLRELDSKIPVVLLTIMMMVLIPAFALAGGHGGGGMSGGMGGCCGGSSYYSYYPSTNTASWLLGGGSPYSTILGNPYGYGGYGYSPSYGIGYGGYGGYPYNTASSLLGGGLYGYSGGIVTGKDYGIEQSYTTWVPGGAVTTSVSENTQVSYPYGGLLGGLGGYGTYGLGGISPYTYGLGSSWI